MVVICTNESKMLVSSSIDHNRLTIINHIKCVTVHININIFLHALNLIFVKLTNGALNKCISSVKSV